MADIFISYKKADRERAASLARVLQAAGYSVWWDTHLRTGDEWFRRILQEVRDAKCLVGVWTHRSIDADGLFAPSADDGHNYISIEHDAAGRARITGAVFEARAVPLVYRDLQAALLTDWDMQDAAHPGLASLIERVGELAGRTAEVPSVAAVSAPTAGPGVEVVADLRATWAGFPVRGNADTVARFLAKVQTVAPGSGLEFEVEHHLDELRSAAERAKAEAEARARREWEERLGPDAARVALAAKAGKPVAERLFPVRLDSVSGWPTPQMVAISPGRFLMGSPNLEGRWDGYDGREEPQHEVMIGYPFALGQHQLTVDEFAAFITETDHDTGKSAFVLKGKKWKDTTGKGWRDPGFAQTGCNPVCCVSWNDAQAYLTWLNDRLGLSGRTDAYRLPSEAEWEYACRAGTTIPFSSGATIAKSQAQFSEGKIGGAGRTAPVGSFPANTFGLHDMHGNVWEWCADPWHENYEGAPTDGSVWEGGDSSRRVLRGGSWSNTPQNLRSADRIRSQPSGRYYVIGFRVARTLSLPTPLMA